MPILTIDSPPAIAVRLLTGSMLTDAVPRLTAFTQNGAVVHPAHQPQWLLVLRDGLGHEPIVLEATAGKKTVGYLPLSFVSSVLFGRFLVSFPYLNTGGVQAKDLATQISLIDSAVELADTMHVRHLELRHETIVDHPRLDGVRDTKVHMRLDLPSFPGPLWEGFKAKVRNQVRQR